MSWLMGGPSCGESIGWSVVRGAAEVKPRRNVGPGRPFRRTSLEPWNEPPAPPAVVGPSVPELCGEQRLLGVDPLASMVRRGASRRRGAWPPPDTGLVAID